MPVIQLPCSMSGDNRLRLHTVATLPAAYYFLLKAATSTMATWLGATS
jgi:hypothetical protein